MSPITRQILEFLAPIIAALVAASLTYAVNWLRKKAKEIDFGIADKAADRIVDELDTAVTKFQPLVEEFKSKAIDHKLDGEQVALLKQKAIDYVTKELAPHGIDVAKTVSAEMLGDWVTHLVEARKDNGPAVSAIATLDRPPVPLQA